MLNRFALNLQLIERIVAETEEDFDYMDNVSLGTKGLKIHFLKGNRKSELEYTTKDLMESYYNYYILPKFSESISKVSITFGDFEKKVNEEVKRLDRNGLTPDYSDFFEKTMDVLLEGKLPFGQTPESTKSQKNENVKRNKKKTEEKAEIATELPDPLKAKEDLKDLEGDPGINGIEIPGETPDIPEEETPEVPPLDTPPTETGGEVDTNEIKPPKGFRRTRDQISRGLSPEEAYAENMEIEKNELITPDSPDNGESEDLGFLND